ncbi:MAG: bifunctional DNA-formamidopyrimidine glycosylase/DNA-(apurinic or apyrimidinic site) lyase [Candidatus Dormibacteraeota bacterium]|nr:bifunctional DNA-formamidopyrimidine glycosylase/DNA-(apurinic or apyrimidinic site) lyase [Candidatus Dormibacteraeota bacterium]
MPELPEVETVAADLRPHLVGRIVVAADLRFPTIVRYPDPARFEAEIVGCRVVGLRRRGKYILHDLDSGAVLVVHLGMTGQWRCVVAGAAEPPHLHLVLRLDDGRLLRYSDTRRFGRVLLGTESELVAVRAMPALGPEPIAAGLTAASLRRRLRGRRAPIKALLLDQRLLAGVGNIYADEALFQAGIRPDRPGGGLGLARAERLRGALHELLSTAIANRGSSVSDYRDAFGETGRNQEVLNVYGRAGEPCVNCGRPLSKTVIGGRTTVFCRRCQR